MNGIFNLLSSRMAVAIALCAATKASGRAAPPVVERVDPPNWWARHQITPVRLMVTGSGLDGARFEMPGGPTVDGVVIGPGGTHAFLNITIPSTNAPAQFELKVTTPGGSTTAPFALLKQIPNLMHFVGFGPDDVVYLAMPDRFANGDPSNDDPAKAPGLLDRKKPRFYHGGDLQGVIDHLPYLKELGVTALWLTPWYDNNDRLNDREKYTPDNKLDPVKGAPITDYHGYGATDLYAVDEHLGNLDTLRTLVEKAHLAGIKVIQDQVANHVGPNNPWVANPPTATWFNGTAANHLANTWQTWTLPDPHSNAAFQRETLDGWFINVLPDLNQIDPECRRFLIQNSIWWIDSTGLDGIREDTLPYVPRTYWREWAGVLKKLHPRLNIVGEVFDGDAAKVSFFQGGRSQFDGVDSGIDTLFDFPLYYRIRESFGEGHSLRPLAEQLSRDHLYKDPDRLVTFIGLHDVERFMNVRGADPAGLKLAFTFLLTARGIPLIYYGDEIGLPGGGDPDNRRDFPGGWPDDPRNAFTQSGRTKTENDLFDHVRTIANARKGLSALRKGKMTHLSLTDQTYAFARSWETNRVIVAINNDRQPQTLDIPVASIGIKDGARFLDLLSPAAAEIENGRLVITLAPRTGAVLR
jgi:neopullulanase